MPRRDPDLERAARGLAFLLRPLERAAGDLTLAQFRVLALIAAGDERSSGVAERLAVAKPTVTAVVDGLVERGLVTREAVAGDRRSLRLVCTPAGNKARRECERTMGEAIERVLAHAHDRDAALAGLGELEEAYTAYVGERISAKADRP